MVDILDLLLKEARIDKWALLQEQQFSNMVGQVAAKDRKLIQPEWEHVNRDDTEAIGKLNNEFKKIKEDYIKYAKTFNEEVIKKLNLDFKTEKQTLVWLLEQVARKEILESRIEEDAKAVKENLELYFKNKGELHKNLFNSSYTNLKSWIKPYRPKGEESKHQDFLSKPDVEGKSFKIYKITKVDQCLKIGKGTHWCIQGDEWAKKYLKKGPLWLVTKNDKRYALIQFESKSFMDVDDTHLEPEAMFEILDIWPEAEQRIKKEVEQDKELLEYIKDEDFQELIVKSNPEAIRYIQHASQKIQDIALKKDPEAIRKIKNPSEKSQEYVVNLDGLTIRHIENPSDKIKLLAVQQNGKAIKYIKNPSVKIQMAAVNNKWIALSLIDDPDPSVIDAAIKKDKRAEEFVHEKA